MIINVDHVIALRKSFDSVKKRQKKNKLSNYDDKKKRLKASREACVGNVDVLKKTIDALSKNGIKVHHAKSKEEALEVIFNEIGSEKLVVKSKSNVTKEIELAGEFEKKGINVVETDIGDRIAQLINANPSHPTGPIAHLSANEIARSLRENGIEIGNEPEDIVSFIREAIIENTKEAKVGITGANALTAEEGSILIVHNEGNIFETMRREKHIVVTSIDKIYADTEEALNMIKILTYNATGASIPSFIEIISGVSRTADVEKKFFVGIHNPKEVVVVLLDNKRSEIIEGGFKELLYCIGCGSCLVNCPMYNTVGNSFAEDNHLGAKGLVNHSIYSGNKNEKLEFCLTCAKCKLSCPLEIDIPKMVRGIRSEGISSEVYYFLKSHIIWIYFNIKILIDEKFKKK